ncbi:uncharacterized protein LOC126722212 [Quercus robur]|uniref:uncharacterized protein LOC126722212 n=1 Tax=Quercus robur TaxID=38942 RepID=UPI002163D847|nr:uncharacterized protein LOC126722212 [Quercus robur]
MAANSYAIGALIAQEDGGGVEQPVYYISCALKDVETRYPRAERACLAIVYASQRLHHYFLAYKYDLRMGTPRVVKSHTIADLLAQFPREEEFPLNDEVLGEVVMAKKVREQWLMKFDGSSTTQSGGVGVVLYYEEDKAVALSFKLEFPYSNNIAEYEAYLTRLATALEIGVKHLKVMGDSNLVVCQAKGIFSLKEPSLTLYRAMAQKMEEKFSTFKIEHAPRNKNQFADALAILGSQIMFEGDNTRVVVSKREESIIEVSKERFREERCEGDWRIPIRETLMKGEGAAKLKVLTDYALVRGELYRRMPGGSCPDAWGRRRPRES